MLRGFIPVRKEFFWLDTGILFCAVTPCAVADLNIPEKMDGLADADGARVMPGLMTAVAIVFGTVLEVGSILGPAADLIMPGVTDPVKRHC